jgi:hypothetical protein
MTPLDGPVSWLFVKGEDTIWVLRSADGHVAVCGPGTEREDFSFDGDKAMEAFQVSFAERLMLTGWILWGVDRERRAGQERRSSARETVDRRVPVDFDSGGLEF